MKTFVSIALVIFAATTIQAQPLTISTVAGYAGKGSTDGMGGGALFLNPQGVAVDGAGNVYVADTGNNTIRVVTPGGVSSTLAGTAGVTGSADGNGPAASFNQPSGIVWDKATNLYVTDYGSSTIRQITLAGHVTTIAGMAGVTGAANLTGTNATFFHPMGIAMDSTTNLYVADYGNHLIRKITPAHAVTTLAGSAGVFGSANGSPGQFYNPEAVAVDASGNVYVADTGNAAIRLITSGGTVSTLAGLPGSLGGTDGSGTNALFYQPAGIAINTASNILYVADYFNNTIRQMSTGGTVVTEAGLAGTTGSTDAAGSLARFWGPQGLAVNSTGTVFIADTANSSIRMMNTSGVVTTLAGSASDGSVNGAAPNARFYSPQNVVVDSATNIYVADTQNSVIRKITPSGVVSVLAGTPGAFGSTEGTGPGALFSAPQGVAVSGNTIYVADTGNSTIRKLTSAGASSTLAGLAGNPGNVDGSGTNAQFNQPEGIAVDSANNVYVADTWNHTIRKITSGGVSSTLAGMAGTFGTFDGTNAGARFNCPTGVAVDGSGNVYVTDFNNNTIRKVTSTGVVTTLAGWSAMWGNSDGAGTNALFFGPAGISVDASGNLYVVDSGNHTLRKVTSLGVVSTVAGLPGVSGSTDGTGTAAGFYYPAGVAVSGAGYVYVADSGNNTIRSQAIPPSFITQPLSQTNVAGSLATFVVSIYGSTPLTYIWRYNTTNLGVNSSSLMTSNAGSYQVTVTNAAGQATSVIATLTLTNSPVGGPGVFQNISVLGNGTVHFGLAGTSGSTYTLDVSTNLTTWSNLVTFTMTNGAVQLNDTGAPNYKARFYKLVSP